MQYLFTHLDHIMRLQRSVLFFIIFAFFIFLQCESKDNLKKNVRRRINMNSKVTGGTPVSIEKFPYAVQFLNSNKACGGVIIHSWAIVTAAHCLDSDKNIRKMRIKAGARYFHDSLAETYRVLHFAMHEEYRIEEPSRDIALVFPRKPFRFGKKIKRAILVNHDKWMDERENTFIVIGWGRTKDTGTNSRRLQMAQMKYFSGKKCSRLKSTTNMFCLYGGGKRDVCNGDSGGGVFWNDMLVGISARSGCGVKNVPSIYTNIWDMKDWINITITRFYSMYCKWKFPKTRTVLQNNFVESLETFI